MYSGREMILILSGGIGSGKSVAAGMLNEMYGFPVYCADRRVKELYEVHPTLLGKIERELGCVLRDDKGRFVPSVLAREIFAEGGAMEKVEALVFPVLKEDFGKWMGENPSGVHIFESATILEKEFFRGFGDLVLIVTAPFEVRLARAMERDNASESQVRARMRKQNIFMDISQLEHHCELPYVLCENAGTKEELRSNLAEIMVKQGLTKML